MDDGCVENQVCVWIVIYGKWGMSWLKGNTLYIQWFCHALCQKLLVLPFGSEKNINISKEKHIECSMSWHVIIAN